MAFKYNRSGTLVVYFKFQNKPYSKTVATKAEGKAWEAEKKKALKEALKNPQAQIQELMYSQAVNDYLLDYEVRFQHNSLREKKSHFTDFAKFIKKDFAMNNITISDCRKFLSSIQISKGDKSANRRLKSMKALWNWHRDSLRTNPWKSVNPYHEDEFTKYVPSKEDVNKVLKIAEVWERNLLQVFIYTGARLSEILNLRWADVNLEEKTIQLWTRKRKGGSKQSRVLPLGTTLFQIVNELYVDNKTNSQYVFVNPITCENYKRNQSSIKNMMERLCKKAEVEFFTFHALRHYFSKSLLESRNASISDIQMLLGHQRATTTDIYLRSMSPEVSHLAELIEGAVG